MTIHTYIHILVEYCTFAYNILFKKNAVVHQSILVEYYYCCFYLNYGTTTAGPDIFIRNKKRSLLCTPHPSEASLNFVEVWQSTNDKTSVQGLCVVLNIVYRTLLE